MCGIAGWVLHPDDMRSFDLAATAAILAKEIEHRGKDATGFLTVNARGNMKVRKAPVRAELFLASREGIGSGARLCLIHTRAATQGSPKIMGNNHPIVSGDIIGIHNGMIRNDDVLFKANPTWVRSFEVDSEVIFAGLDKVYPRSNQAEFLEMIEGSMAIAWINKRDPFRLNLAKGAGNPINVMWNEQGSLFFASTYMALKEAAKLLPEEWTIKTESFAEGEWLDHDGVEAPELTRFQPKKVYVGSASNGTTTTYSSGTTPGPSGGSTPAQTAADRSKMMTYAHRGIYGGGFDWDEEDYHYGGWGEIVERATEPKPQLALVEKVESSLPPPQPNGQSGSGSPTRQFDWDEEMEARLQGPPVQFANGDRVKYKGMYGTLAFVNMNLEEAQFYPEPIPVDTWLCDLVEPNNNNPEGG